MARCADCKKKAPVHYRHWITWYDKKSRREVCCSSFHYWVTYRLWCKVSKLDRCEQLCLFCLRQRLGRGLTIDDFPDVQSFNSSHLSPKAKMAYIKKMIAYANSGKNTSKVW